ncbi:MAG: hypothetical protein R3E95_23580 [Thiolinea sp.]
MELDLRAALPILLPKAVAWAEAQSSLIAQTGQPLNDQLLLAAKNVGVQHPELIHIAEVSNFPFPEDQELQIAAIATGLLGPETAGITFGHSIYILEGYATITLLSHEFRHVYQYEQAGSISNFLTDYLQQIVSFGYYDAPLEVDARAHETMID